jgi:hypothetical protein
LKGGSIDCASLAGVSSWSPAACFGQIVCFVVTYRQKAGIFAAEGGKMRINVVYATNQTTDREFTAKMMEELYEAMDKVDSSAGPGVRFCRDADETMQRLDQKEPTHLLVIDGDLNLPLEQLAISLQRIARHALANDGHPRLMLLGVARDHEKELAGIEGVRIAVGELHQLFAEIIAEQRSSV